MSKAGREQRLAALAIKKMAIVCSTNNRFENAAIFSGKRLTALSQSEAHALLNLEHRWRTRCHFWYTKNNRNSSNDYRSCPCVVDR